MKKKLLVLAIATALPMGAAQAGVTIYGKIHASVDYIDPNGSLFDDAIDDTIDDDDFWDVTSRASRIGFKGSEDLGDGLKLIWKVESGVDIANGGNTGGTYWSARNAYIGLAGGWGTFLYGRHDTPMKMSTGKLDLFSDELGDYNATAGFIDMRADDAIAYISPSWGGLTLAAAVIPDGDYDLYDLYIPLIDETIPGDGGDFAGGYSLAAMWNLNNFFLAAAYESLDDLLYGVDAAHWRIGAGADFGGFHIGAIYQDADDFGFDSYLINGAYAFGNSKVKAEWGQVDPNWGSKSDAWAVGYDYNFSKRSKMYAQYADSEHGLQSTNAVGEQSGFSFGMVHKF